MIGVDTNVLVRFLVDDDPLQNQQAKAFMISRSADDPAFVSAITLAETVWVLNRRLGFAIDAVVGILRDLLASEALIIEHGEELGRMIESKTPDTDFADYLISWSGLAAGCSHTVTFDRRAARSVPGMELLK